MSIHPGIGFYSLSLLFHSKSTSSLICGEKGTSYPMKFITTRWRMTLAKMKSAKALSGEIPLKSEEFSGLL